VGGGGGDLAEEAEQDRDIATNLSGLFKEIFAQASTPLAFSIVSEMEGSEQPFTRQDRKRKSELPFSL